jgi:hypothetical protein
VQFSEVGARTVGHVRPPVCLSVCRCLSATPGRRRLCRRRRTDRKKDGQVLGRSPPAGRSADPSHHVLEEPGILPHRLRRQGLLQQPRVRGTWQRPMRHLVHLHPGLVQGGSFGQDLQNPKTGVINAATDNSAALAC